MLEFIHEFWINTGVANFVWQQPIMIVIGLVLIYLAIVKGYEPLLLVPIGFGVVVGNMPYAAGEMIGVYDVHGSEMSTFAYLYFLVHKEILPPLIFMGVGVLTDFSCLISNPRLVLLGAAAQAGVFITFFGAILLGFSPAAAAAIGIIGGADGPTAIYIAAKMAPAMLGTIAISAYSYMSLVPVIQPPIMRLLTTKEERMIRMPPPRPVSRRLRIIFPLIGFAISALIIPSSIPLMGMLFLGNLIRECGVTERLSKTIGTSFIDTVTVILGFCVGLGTTYDKFLKPDTLKVFALGAFAFAVATAVGILAAKGMNLVSKNKINPLVGSAGVSAVPMAARVSQQVAAEEDPTNYLIFHAMAPNVAGVIGTAVAAGVFIAMLS